MTRRVYAIQVRRSAGASYRRLVPSSVRHPLFLLRKQPARLRARRRQRQREKRATIIDQWTAYVDRPLGPPLSPTQLGEVKASYRRLRELQVRVRTPGYLRQYAKRMKQTQFRLAASAAEYYEREPLLDDHVMYESYNCRDFAGNPYAIFRHLLQHPDYSHLQHVIAIEDLDNPKVRPFADHPRVRVVQVHSNEFIRYAESCKFYINNASYKPYLIKRPDQVYLTTWHSTLLKKLGVDTLRPWETVNVSRALLASDFHLSPNPYTTEILFRSHAVNGLVHGAVYEMGYPRNDLTINVDRDDVRSRLGCAAGRKVAVYAPTWRGSYVPEDTAAETLAYAEAIRERLPDGYDLYVKFHTLVYRYIDESMVEGVAPLDLDTNELLGVTDLLVTDYSGIFFDYLLTGNPVVYVTPDREAYSAAKQGFYMDLEELPGPLCDDVDELADMFGRLDDVQAEYAERYRDFVDRFVGADDGNVCERVVRLLFGGESFEQYRSAAPGATPDRDKQTLLFYPANLAGNGVTESFVALTHQLDYARFNVLVMLPNTSKYREMQQRLHTSTRLFYQNASDGYLPEEFIKERSMVDLGVAGRDDVPVAAFRRTIRRIFCDLNFDAAINYNGYFPNAAAKFAFGVESQRRIIYMHNDLERDREIKHPQLLSVFSLYQFHDRVVCVSGDSLESNIEGAARRVQYTFGVDLTDRMVYSRNLIVPEAVRERAAQGSLATVKDQSYLAIRNATNRSIEGYEFDPRFVNFVCVGRLSPEKNHHRLLHAFERLAATRDDVRLYIVGTGTLNDSIREEAVNLGLADKVIFTGFLANPLSLVKQADCFVLTSDIEGQPITVLESLVLGKPVIATDIAGPRDLLQHGEGQLVEPTVEAFADALIRFSSDAKSPHQAQFDAEAYVEDALAEFYSLLPSP